ncbi:MAG: cytochrome C oxidase subunit IV family protein [SAR324 cluster bacterium]|nr:cytochrome C oxidase subunit IV family protein [SAR324 cluster bacterium]
MSADAHAADKAHPGPKTYALIAAILCIITLLEFGAFYTEALQGILVPLLVVMSVIKFSLVAMFYMHLKFDHPVLTKVLIGGVALGFGSMLWLLALFTYSHPIASS